MKGMLLCFSLVSLYLWLNVFEVEGARWSEEQANRWYSGEPLFFGANFVPSTAVNSIEMWQSFDVRTIARELQWASEIHMNVMRVFLHILFYEENRSNYLEKIDQFLRLADASQIRIIFVLFDECWQADPHLGPQADPIPGVHNSQWVRCPGQRLLQNRTAWPFLQQYTYDVLTRFGKDSRVAVWDLYNEPECSQQVPLVLELLPSIYSAALRANPQQPLTIGIATDDLTSPLAQFEIQASDIITFHNYEPLLGTIEQIAQLRQLNRPLICTEYMARSIGSTFHTHTKYYHGQGIGALNWGLVAGKTQTFFPWGSPRGASVPLVWFHDIFNSTGEGYSLYEMEFFKDLKGPPAPPFSFLGTTKKLAVSFYRFLFPK